MTIPPVVPGTPEDPAPRPSNHTSLEQASGPVAKPSRGQVSRRITDKDLAQIAELLTDRSKRAAGASGAPAGPTEPNMRESLLADSKTLFGGVGALIICYVIAIYLAVHESLFCGFFFAMALTYSALFAGMLANRFRLAFGAFVAVGVLMVSWALVAVSFGAYHYALAVAAYGVWARVTTAAFCYGEGRSRDWVLALVAHGLALAGFILVDVGWAVDSPVAGLSISTSLALGCLALHDHRTLKVR